MATMGQRDIVVRSLSTNKRVRLLRQAANIPTCARNIPYCSFSKAVTKTAQEDVVFSLLSKETLEGVSAGKTTTSGARNVPRSVPFLQKDIVRPLSLEIHRNAFVPSTQGPDGGKMVP